MHVDAIRASKQRWNVRNAEKRKAHKVVEQAIAKGDLVPLPCCECGAVPAEAHHDDYAKPLDVRWLCSKHHSALHRAKRLASRSSLLFG